MAQDDTEVVNHGIEETNSLFEPIIVDDRPTPEPKTNVEKALAKGEVLDSFCIKCQMYFVWCKCPANNVDKIVPGMITMMGMEARWYGELFHTGGEINTGFGYH